MDTIRKQLDRHAIGIMLILGVLFYFLPGEWIRIEDDTAGYLAERGKEGILPGYPMFLGFFKTLLGQQYYLHGVVAAQCILAIICTLLFVLTLRAQFRLRGEECILLYVGSMLPFSIYLPESGITHQILTEGITYALFYLFFITVIKAVWSLQYKWYLGSVFMAFVLGLIRSQMLFLQAVCLLVVLWISVRRYGKGFWQKCGICLLTFSLGIVVAFGSYKTIYGVVALEIKSQTQNKTDTGENNSSVRDATSQFTAIIIARGFYEADEEDADLFEDEMMRDIFLSAYRLADADGHRYEYASQGLYMWQDLVYDRMRKYAVQAIEEYDALHPDIRDRSTDSIARELGLRILLKHFDRYLYHTIRLMIPSFIASVFFQIAPIYLLCHFIALFLYLAALIGSVVVYKVHGDKRAVELMLTTLCVLLLMVGIVNMVFMGLQRYVVYGMGIFYCSLYLICRELVVYIFHKRKCKS